MAYVPKIFKDRAVEFPFRRLLTPVSGQANTVDVSRVPGTIFEVGDEPDAANLNAEFGKIKTETDAISTSLNGYANTLKRIETVLWSGSQATVGTISLSDSILNYKKIKIYIMSNSYLYEEVKEIDVNDITVAEIESHKIVLQYFSNTSYYFSLIGWFTANNSFTLIGFNVMGFSTPTLYKIVGVN